MSAATIISPAFGEGANLYTAVLGLEVENGNYENITQSQLRKAYYRRALLYHPDKQKQKSKKEKEDAKLKFQAVSLAYTILKDNDKRKEYDECGEIDDEFDNDDDQESGKRKSGTDMWKEFFTSTFGKVTTKNIDEFAQSYKCSDEEERDVLKYYTMFKGNLDKMLECVMCSDVIDKERWVEDYIKPAIQNESVEDFSDQIHMSLDNNESSKNKKKNKKGSKSNNREKKQLDKSEEEEEEEEEIQVETDDDDGAEESDGDDCASIDAEAEADPEVGSKSDDPSKNDSMESADETITDDDKTETEEDSDNSSSNSLKEKKRPSSSRKLKVRSTTTFSASSSRKRKQGSNHEQTPMQKKVKKKKKSGAPVAPNDDLIAAIRGNAVARRGGQEAFGSFMNSLEQRYSSSKSKKKRKMLPTPADIPDDEFAKIQARLLKKK